MRNIKQFESFSKEKEIHDICEKYNIKDYTINDDLSIDVRGSVNLYNKGLTELPLTFNIVEGVFHCSNNKLTNLNGSPRKCKSFYCYDNKLTSLEGAPIECEDFYCDYNSLTNLEGAPDKCEYFYCSYNNLTSLKGAPNECEYFYCSYNNLTSLKGAPKKCEKFYCDNNSLTNLEDGPVECTYFYCDNNSLTNLEGGPKKCEYFALMHNFNLKSLKYIANISCVNLHKSSISSFEYLSNRLEIIPNDNLMYICRLIGTKLHVNYYQLDMIDSFNEYEIIDDKDYVNNKADKATLNILKLKNFLKEKGIKEVIDVKELEKYFYVK